MKAKHNQENEISHMDKRNFSTYLYEMKLANEKLKSAK